VTTLTTHVSHHDLPVQTREQMIALLNQQLADTSDLYSQAKQAHWNVKGPQFFQLHELFDELAKALEQYVDLLAERVTALGGDAMGTDRTVAAASRLPDYPETLAGGLQHVATLAERYAHYAFTTRTATNAAADAGDAGTADLFTEISRGVDKHLWFLEAHLES
jgi:starvation-inducible DNA-binding protein